MIETPISKAISLAPTYKEKAQIVWDHYLSRQLPVGSLEPNWVHVGYELVHKFILGEKLQPEELELTDQIIASHSLKDGHTVSAFPGQPKSPMRIIHDGWKAGTPTWIFMGRALTPESVIDLTSGWVAVKRTIPDDFYADMDQEAAPSTLWMAYRIDKQMGVTALTSNIIGPAISFSQLWEAICKEYGPLAKTEANEKYE